MDWGANEIGNDAFAFEIWPLKRVAKERLVKAPIQRKLSEVAAGLPDCGSDIARMHALDGLIAYA